jgi:hypothetical protein
LVINKYKLPIKILCKTDFYYALINDNNIEYLIDRYENKKYIFDYNYIGCDSLLYLSIYYFNKTAIKYLLANNVYYVDKKFNNIMTCNLYKCCYEITSGLIDDINYSVEHYSSGFDINYRKLKKYIINAQFFNSLRYNWINTVLLTDQ